jgi:hypothetical protein
MVSSQQCFSIGSSARICLYGRSKLSTNQQCDVMRGAIVVIVCFCLQQVDASKLYHMIRAQVCTRVSINYVRHAHWWSTPSFCFPIGRRLSSLLHDGQSDITASAFPYVLPDIWQETIKLYVIFNVLEIFDKYCAWLGQDILDALFVRKRQLRIFFLAVAYTRMQRYARGPLGSGVGGWLALGEVRTHACCHGYPPAAIFSGSHILVVLKPPGL